MTEIYRVGGVFCLKVVKNHSMDLPPHPIRWSITAIAALILVIFAIRDSQMGSASVNPEDLLFLLGIYGIPFVIFVFMVWSGRWRELRSGPENRTTRHIIALIAEIAGALAAGMFLLNLPLWVLLASGEAFGVAWMIAGLVISTVAVLCALAGSPLLWRHAIASALLLPFWVVDIGLLAKTIMD